MLDLGCGEGYCARNYLKMGAAAVHGVDISAEMISLAQANTPDPRASFERASIAEFAAQQDAHAGRYDVVTAVFVSNYLDSRELATLVTLAHACLKAGGQFVLLHPHPHLPYHRQSASAGLRFEVDESASYFDSIGDSHVGRIVDLEGKTIEVRLVHHTLEELFGNVIGAGLRIDRFRELRLDKPTADGWPALADVSLQTPLHIMISSTRD